MAGALAPRGAPRGRSSRDAALRRGRRGRRRRAARLVRARPPRGRVLSSGLARVDTLRARRRRGPPRVGRGRHPQRACRRSRSSGSPTRRCARRASACARRSRTRASSSRTAASRSTSRPAYLRKVGPGFDLAARHRDPRGERPARAERARRLRGRRRAVAHRRGARRSRGALAIAEGARAPRARAAACVPRARAREAALVAGARGRSASTTCRRPSRCCAATREPAPLPAGAAPDAEPPAERARPRPTCAATTALDPGARGRRRRRAQPVPARPAGHRQDDARAPAARRCCRRSTRARGDRGHAAALDRRPARRRRARSSGGRSARRTTRSPPPASSAAASPPTPGEATLAHHGVLFLDELSEFTRPALEALRQPLEDGRVTIVRAQRVMVLPDARHARRRVEPVPVRAWARARAAAAAADLARHQRRLSGPLLDRIDVSVTVARPSAAGAAHARRAPASADVRAAHHRRPRAPDRPARRAPA